MTNHKTILIERKLRIWLFLAFYFLHLQTTLLHSQIDNGIIHTITFLVSGFLFACTVFVNIPSFKPKILRNKAIRVFIYGMLFWVLFGLFCALVKLNQASYRELLALSTFTVTVLLGARFVYMYNLTRKLLKIAVFCLGTTLLIHYIIYFDNFQAFNPQSLRALFMSGGRYRYSFGLGHVNGTGLLCTHYLVWLAIYKNVLKEEKYSDWLYPYFLLICLPISVIMLVSSASRSSITGVIGFWLVFYFIDSYQKLNSRIKFLFVFLIFTMLLSIVLMVDWEFVYLQSNRAINFLEVPDLTQNSLWLIGLGANGSYIAGGIKDILAMSYLDNYYLWVILQGGLIGCICQFGAIFYFTFRYFKNINIMPVSHKLCAGLLAYVLYHGLFEATVYGHGTYQLTDWILIMLCMIERNSIVKAHSQELKLNTQLALQ